MMENILNGLQAGTISDRAAAIEKLSRRLAQGKPLQEKPDNLVKLISHTVSNLRDANVKIVLQSLEVVEMFMHLHPESFPKLINLCFELLMAKYSHGKAAVRNKATEVMVELIGMTDLAAGYDRLYRQIQHSGKSVRVKEQIIYSLLLLHSTYGEEVLHIPDLLKKLGALLGDSTASVRNLAIDALATLYAYMGDRMLLELEAQGVRTDRVVAIQDAVVSESYLAAMEPVREVALALLEKRQNSAQEAEYNGSKYGFRGDASPDGTVFSAESFGSSDAVMNGRPSSGRGGRGLARSTNDGVVEAYTGGNVDDDYDGAAEDKQSMRPLLRRAKTSSSVASKKTLSATMGPPSLASSPVANGSSTSSSSSSNNYSQYDPRYYLELLRDGPLPQPTRLYSEKELQREAAKAMDLCGRTADWQERMKGLSLLQALVLGDALEYERDLVSILKKNHDILIAQISDLRSVLSKEGCRTVGILARRLGPSFHPLVDVLVPPLLKLLLLKIKIMSGAADRTMRILISTSSAGYPRMLPHLLEQSASKNAIVRRSCFEYLSMCCALWKAEVLESKVTGIKRAIKPGISDADAGVRRAARHTFWVLEQRSPFHNTMLEFLESLEVPAQRHLHKELQDSVEGGGDGELELLFALSQTPLAPFSSDMGATLAALDDVVDRDLGKGSENEGNENLPIEAGAELGLGGARRTFPFRDRVGKGHNSVPFEYEPGAERVLDAGEDKPEREPYILSERRPQEQQIQLPRSQQAFDHAPSGMSTDRSSPPTAKTTSKFSVLATERESEGGSGSGGEDMGTVITSTSAPGALEGAGTHTAASKSGAASALTTLKARVPGRARLGGAAARVPVTQMGGNGSKNGGGKSLLRGAQRVQVPAASAKEAGDSSILPSAPKPAPAPGAVSEAEVAAAFCPSLEELKRMAQDEAWTARLEALVALSNRLKASSSPASSPPDPSAPRKAGLSNIPNSLSAGLLAEYVDLALDRLPDVHQKVAQEALNAIQLCVDIYADTSTMKAELGPLLVGLFHRLGDKRQPVRERANALLNSVRLEFEPVAVVAALIPRILDLPDRTKTAVMQFLGVTVPHCGAYFQEGKHTWAFLGRMASVFGTTGTKPSASLQAAGSRLMELVYKAAPSVILLQLSLLPLGQQELLKRILETIEPNIDALVSAAGRQAGAWAPPLPGPATTTPASASISSSTSPSLAPPEQDGPISVPVEQPAEQEQEQNDEWTRGTQRAPPSIITTTALSSPISSPRGAESSFAVPSFGDPASPLRPLVTSPAVMDRDKEGDSSSSVEKMGIAEGRKSPHATLRASPVTVPPPAGKIPSPGIQKPLIPPASIPAEGDNKPNSADVDMAWLLEALSPSGGRTDKKDAVKVLRHLARVSHERDHGAAAWWGANCAQIVSVLLEALSAHQANAVGDANAYGADGAAATTESETAAIAVENMHTACKVLLLLVKYQAQVMLNLCELLATRLCQSATFAPISVTLHCEQILMDLAKLDGRRMLKLILPFSREAVSTRSQPTPVKLLALHVIAGTLRSVPSPVLLAELSGLVEASLPSLSSDVVDLRKAVIFVLVEAYMVVGDALYPFVQDLAPPQKKLLTIYIDRQLESKGGGK